MKCPVCGFDKPLANWMTVKDKTSQSSVVTPRIHYYTPPTSKQYENLYACPKCGVVRVRKIGDR